jgi:hypothetical protein
VKNRRRGVGVSEIEVIHHRDTPANVALDLVKSVQENAVVGVIVIEILECEDGKTRPDVYWSEIETGELSEALVYFTSKVTDEIRPFIEGD